MRVFGYLILRIRAVTLATVLVLAGLATPAAAFEIKQVTSPGGITAWLVEDHTIPLIAMNFSFSGGAAAGAGRFRQALRDAADAQGTHGGNRRLRDVWNRRSTG